MTKIQVRNVYKIFGPHPKKAMDMLAQGKSKAEIMAAIRHGVGVHNASFEVQEGETVVIMGLSGSGKSTLVRCLNRLITPTAGSVLIDGKDVMTMGDRELRQIRQRKMAMVFQNFALFPHRTVRENTAMGLEIQGIPKAERLSRATEVLALVGLETWADAYPRELSGGMQQRVGLARALALSPDILLMDEAFSALDPLIRRDMQDELINMQNTLRKTIVFISHDLDEALKLGDRVILMKDGAIVQVGTPEQILTSPATEYVARFVQDVDVTKVFTAESVMKHSEAVAYLPADGPRAALRKMRKHNIAYLFVVDHNQRLVGIVSADAAASLAAQGKDQLSEGICTDIKTVLPSTPAQELFEIMSDLPYPLAVADENNKFKGVIVRGTLVAVLAERGGVA